MLNGVKKGSKYPESVRSFCLSVHFYSPRAYEFIREAFENNLPSVSALKKWYANCNVLCQPGVTQFSLDVIKKLSNEMAKEGKSMVCSLAFDEVHIRKNIQFVQPRSEVGRFLGFISYGNTENLNETGVDSNNVNKQIANQAIVFMINGINCNIRVPVAFHFINSLNYEQRANLLLEVVHAVSECNVEIANITFDGAPANGKMCTHLNANIIGNPNNFVTEITNPFNQKPIRIVYDPSHMIKLVRNTLGRKQIIYDGSNRKIEWKYFEYLEKFNRVDGLNLCNKLSKRHIQWTNNKMNVKLAVQTLSNSVANAMLYLMEMGYSEFAGASATIQFIRCFNKLFDTMDSRYRHSHHDNILKRPFNAENKRIVSDTFEKAINYIKSLKLQQGNSNSKVNILETKVRCGFRGFIINMKSIKNIYTDYVENSKTLKSLPVFSLSQDHLESFFGKIRSLNGCNDNPTVQQFSSAYKKLLTHSDIKLSELSNCEDSLCQQITSDILTVSSKKPKSPQEPNDEENILDIAFTVNALGDNSHIVETLGHTSIAYVASKIEEKILKSDVNCQQCATVFDENQKVSDIAVFSSVLNPCKSTYLICKICDRVLETHKFDLFKKTLNFSTLYYHILKEIGDSNFYTDSDFSQHADHKHYLIRLIIDEYIRIKATQQASSMTLDLQDKLVRHGLRKLIHFKGQ